MDKNNKIKTILSKMISYIAIILSVIPIILFIYLLISSHGSFNENGDGSIWWFLFFYYATVGIPFFITSIILGFLGLKYSKMASLISLSINFIKIIFMFILLIIF